MTETTDTGYAPTRWNFDEEVTRVFDDMLQRSVPQYEVMRETVTKVAERYAVDEAYIVDIGASRGEATQRLTETIGARCRYCMVEVSKPMLEALLRRFEHSLQSDYGFRMEVLDYDLRKRYPQRRACVTLMVLSLQFTPIEHRQRIVREAFKNTIPGGCLILVEKVIGSSAEADDLIAGLYKEAKLANGYTQEEVDRKALSLEGVLVPVTAGWNEELLKGAGFDTVECFWRWSNFAGWVAVKG